LHINGTGTTIGGVIAKTTVGYQTIADSADTQSSTGRIAHKRTMRDDACYICFGV
jgi:hypothetical protein